jgi:hypothetical protein
MNGFEPKYCVSISCILMTIQFNASDFDSMMNDEALRNFQV